MSNYREFAADGTVSNGLFNNMNLNLKGKVAVVTGAAGAICGEIAKALAQEKVCVAIWDLSLDAACRKRDSIVSAGDRAIAVQCDATNKSSVAQALQQTLDEYTTVDILVNGAGGSRSETTTSPELSFFDIEPADVNRVMSLNYTSAVVPSQALGRIFARKGSGVILNISSVAGIGPLTRAIAYSNGKAATNSFTQWLAVHMAREYSPNIRVNAIAPGFVLTDQNRFLLVDDNGQGTERGKQIIQNVPAGRYAQPQEIAGAALWLVSEQASFVTGVILPVDGGFTAFSGV